MSEPMSAFGPKQTSAIALHMSAFGGKADVPFAILGCSLLLRFAEEAEIQAQ
jgi:hypothetical protein